MKTLLFITGLAFNIFLCLNPFGDLEHGIPEKNDVITGSGSMEKAITVHEELSYSTMLKNKAAALAKKY